MSAGREEARVEKVDLKRDLSKFYLPPSNEVVKVDVPPMAF